MMGKLEETILLMLVRLGETGSSNLTTELGKTISVRLGAVYTTLTRMETKGWVTRRIPNETNGPKSLFTITAEGQNVLRDSLKITEQLLHGLHI